MFWTFQDCWIWFVWGQLRNTNTDNTFCKQNNTFFQDAEKKKKKKQEMIELLWRRHRSEAEYMWSITVTVHIVVVSEEATGVSSSSAPVHVQSIMLMLVQSSGQI